MQKSITITLLFLNDEHEKFFIQEDVCCQLFPVNVGGENEKTGVVQYSFTTSGQAVFMFESAIDI